MKSFLNSLFDELKTEADLAKLVQEQREEDLHLEFKQKQNPSTDKIGDDDRKNFSKSVAGFANADGGVLVFGIQTKKNPDRAVALESIAAAQSFAARLRDSVINTTQPPVDSVRVEAIPGKASQGYVKCLIHASDLVPHRAMHADGHYWRRMSVGGFRRMEHYELEEVFGRRRRPVLRLRILLLPEPGNDAHEMLNFCFRNDGRGLGHHVGFHCWIRDGDVVSTRGNYIENVSKMNGRPSVSYYNPLHAVHPNGIFAAVGDAIIRRSNKEAPLPIDVTWYADNTNTRSAKVRLKPGQPQLLKGRIRNGQV